LVECENYDHACLTNTIIAIPNDNDFDIGIIDHKGWYTYYYIEEIKKINLSKNIENPYKDRNFSLIELDNNTNPHMRVDDINITISDQRITIEGPFAKCMIMVELLAIYNNTPSEYIQTYITLQKIFNITGIDKLEILKLINEEKPKKLTITIVFTHEKLFLKASGKKILIDDKSKTWLDQIK
jgi:hypothetical protein